MKLTEIWLLEVPIIKRNKYKIPFLDLSVVDKEERENILNSINVILKHGRFILGPEVSIFEKRIAKYCNRKFAVGVNSGTDAIYLSLKSLGVGKGDEVITTSLSWIATANAIQLTGAKPVFADIGDDLNIDPDSVNRLISDKTKALLPVHYNGKVCEIDKLHEIATKNNLFLVEDASQAFGAKYNDKVAGSFGKIACFSLNPMKILPAMGEAGVIVTDNHKVNDKLIQLRYNGMIKKEICLEPSLNCRIDTIQAAILLIQLDKLNEVITKRRKIASLYNKRLSNLVEIPYEKNKEFDVYYTYTIRSDRRNELYKYLNSKGIEAKIRDPLLMPNQPAYKNSANGEYSNAQKTVKTLLSLPISDKITLKDAQYVVKCIKDFFRSPLDE